MHHMGDVVIALPPFLGKERGVSLFAEFIADHFILSSGVDCAEVQSGLWSTLF